MRVVSRLNVQMSGIEVEWYKVGEIFLCFLGILDLIQFKFEIIYEI